MNFTPVDDANAATTNAATMPASSIEPALAMPPPPLNDKIDIIPDRAPQARAGRGLTRFVLTVFAGIAATIGWQAYGEEAQQMFATARAAAARAGVGAGAKQHGR